MDKESKLIIERLMQEGLALKALLHRSGIVFYEADTSHLEEKSYVNPVNLETRLPPTDTFSVAADLIEPKKTAPTP